MITIFTPTYNRAYIIKNLYDSLLSQTNQEFEWLIVDDGSNDNTKSTIEGFIKEDKIQIRYYFKKNGGKHTAINKGIQLAERELFFIVDSDDYLKNNAIEIILNEWTNIKNDHRFSGICFRKIEFKSGKILGKKLPSYKVDTDIFTLMRKYKVLGDKAEVFRTEYLKKYHFPEISNEKFMSELYVWMELFRNNQMRFIDEGIYYCEYLEDGYTKNMNKLLKSNPIGSMMYYKKIINEPRFGLVIRAKSFIRYVQVLFYKRFCRRRK